MSARDGAGGAVRGLVGDAAREHASIVEAARGEQVPMFEPPTRFHGNRRDGVRLQTERHARAGRPAGSQNLSNVQFREYLHRMGVSPLVAMMRFAMMPPHLLALELGCTKLEAFREWRILQSELAPYLHAKMLPVDDDGKVPPFLQMVFGNAGQKADVEPWRYLDATASEVQQNQPISSDRPAMSDGDVSDDGTK